VPAGIETSPEIVAKFRAHYLYSGNAAESAREVNIPERTGRDIAERLTDDPSFAADRRRLRAIELEESIVARRRVRQKALERFESEDGGIDTKRLGLGEDATVVITDKRHEYGKLVLDADKGAQSLAKLDADNDPSKAARPVMIQFVEAALPSEGDASGNG
jgi:predicted protein tyrosine phosphatase